MNNGDLRNRRGNRDRQNPDRSDLNARRLKSRKDNLHQHKAQEHPCKIQGQGYLFNKGIH